MYIHSTQANLNCCNRVGWAMYVVFFDFLMPGKISIAKLTFEGRSRSFVLELRKFLISSHCNTSVSRTVFGVIKTFDDIFSVFVCQKSECKRYTDVDRQTDRQTSR